MSRIENTTAPLVVDCQIFQSQAWERGMGKYSMALLQALLGLPAYQDRQVHFIFTAKAEANKPVRALLKQIAPRAKFIDLELGLPKQPRDQFSIQPIRLNNKLVLNKYIDQDFADSPGITFLILSLYLDEVVSVFPDSAKVIDKVVLYYDSIPYLYHLRYGVFKGFFDHFYMPHTASVLEATKVLTISKTVANDLQDYFGIPKERIFNIDGASIPREITPVMPKSWKYKPGTFVLMPTGQEIRKNNNRAVQAFEAFLKESGKNYQIVITSNFNDEGREELRKLSPSVDFSGNVSEAELLWLYQNCRFVLFPSEYEGLGLPVLEAVEQDKPVACSDISVFREMSTAAFCYFDPTDVQSITTGLLAVEAEATAEVKKEDSYRGIKQKYTWPQTAKLCASALEASIDMPLVKKKKIAIFCPEPSGFSAIGKLVGELHAWYSQYFEIDYYFDRGPNHRMLRPNYLKYAAACRDAKDFKAADYDGYEAVIYHIGNSEYHLNSIRTALALPGYMILHDTDLAGAFHNLLHDEYISQERYNAEKTLDVLACANEEKRRMSSFLTSLVNSQKAIVTHSHYAKRAVTAKLLDEDTKVEFMELPYETLKYRDINRPISSKKVSIAFAGIIAKIKGIDIIDEIAMSDDFSDCQIYIFGFSAVDTEQIKKLKQMPHVHVMTNPTDFEFQELSKKSDILVNVRQAYRGETSASTLSHMRYGGIELVRDFGWFGELPDDAVVKITDPSETVNVLRGLVSDVARRERLAQKVIAFMNVHHTHKAYAGAMYDLIDKN